MKAQQRDVGEKSSELALTSNPSEHVAAEGVPLGDTPLTIKTVPSSATISSGMARDLADPRLTGDTIWKERAERLADEVIMLKTARDAGEKVRAEIRLEEAKAIQKEVEWALEPRNQNSRLVHVIAWLRDRVVALEAALFAEGSKP